MATDKIHSHEPFREADFGVLKDGSNGFTEIMVAVGTNKTSILTLMAMVCAAVRADNITVSPTSLSKGCFAFSGGIKVEGNVHEGVETREVYHSKNPVLFSILYLNNTGFFPKSPDYLLKISGLSAIYSQQVYHSQDYIPKDALHEKIQSVLDSGKPVQIGYTYKAKNSGHSVVAIGYTNHKSRLRLFCLDPGFELPKASFWNRIVDIELNYNKKLKYTDGGFSDDENYSPLVVDEILVID